MAGSHISKSSQMDVFDGTVPTIICEPGILKQDIMCIDELLERLFELFLCPIRL